MALLIILFIMLSLLVSIVICKDNQYVVNLLFAGYLILAFTFLFAIYFCKPTVTFDGNSQYRKFYIYNDGPDVSLDEKDMIEQNKRVPTRVELDAFQTEELAEDEYPSTNA